MKYKLKDKSKLNGITSHIQDNILILLPRMFPSYLIFDKWYDGVIEEENYYVHKVSIIPEKSHG